MVKYFSFGEYNKLYKYIWIYLIIRFVSLFVYDYELVFDQFQNEPLKIPYSSFISIQFNYIGFIIISIFILAIKRFLIKKRI